MRKQLTFMAASAVSLAAFAGLAGTTQPAQSAVIYCTYIGYPAGCVVRPGVRLVARPVARSVGVGYVGAPSAGNWNGGVNRVGRRR